MVEHLNINPQDEDGTKIFNLWKRRLDRDNEWEGQMMCEMNRGMESGKEGGSSS